MEHRQPSAVASPSQFGRYVALELIGKGSTGEVYRALDPVTGREVAVKALHASPFLAAHLGDCRRYFQREAEAAGCLSHPNIVVIYDVGEDFLVMELLDGLTLRALLDGNTTFDLSFTLSVIEPIAAALDYAHGKGVIHRDVKPGNIMILPEGTPKLMDFGGAHLEAVAATSPGLRLGLPSYMAPEQIRGERVSGRTDIFALAAVFYEMVAGCRAFPGDSIPAIADRVLHEEPPPPSSIVPGLPPRCDAAVLRALHKDPSQRFAAATDFVLALRGQTTGSRSKRTATAKGQVRSVRTDEIETQDIRRVGSPRRRLPLAAIVLALPLTASTTTKPIPHLPRPHTELTVLSQPAGAIVWVDNRPAGRTPLRIERVRIGSHNIRLSAPGRAPAEVVLAVSETEREPLMFNLQPLPAALQPSPATPLRPTAAIQPPRKLDGRLPSYPWEFLRLKLQGRVVVELTVTEKGQPIDLRIVEAPGEPLAKAVLEAVRTWRFEPARRAGVPIAMRWRVTHTFTVR